MKAFTLLFTLLLVTAIAWFVWPTQFRYDHMSIGPSSLLTRESRLSGKTEVLYPGTGWRDASGARPKVWE